MYKSTVCTDVGVKWMHRETAAHTTFSPNTGWTAGFLSEEHQQTHKTQLRREEWNEGDLNQKPVSAYLSATWVPYHLATLAHLNVYGTVRVITTVVDWWSLTSMLICHACICHHQVIAHCSTMPHRTSHLFSHWPLRHHSSAFVKINLFPAQEFGFVRQFLPRRVSQTG